MGFLRKLLGNTEVKEYGKNMLEEVVSAIVSADVVALGKFFRDLLNGPYFIQEQIFWTNFYDYLDNACDSKEDLIKLSARLAEDGNSV